MISQNNIRNVAIIAHVDHGKTTIISKMYEQSDGLVFGASINLDNNTLEKERGITILAKCTSINFGGIKYNIIDTPGHADFGGEVERILSMVDGAIILVDSSEGVMPQTKFVVSKALKAKIKPIVVINKIDRADSRISEVIDEILGLFIALDADDTQIDFPILYAAGRDGWATKEIDQKTDNLNIIFDTIKDTVSPPKVEHDSPFSMLATMLTSDQYVGRLLIGKIYSGSIKVGDSIKTMNLSGKTIEQTRLTKIFGFQGSSRVPIESAIAGDIIAVAGTTITSVSDTICSLQVEKPIASTEIDPPTMSITISVNDSPFAGKEGSKVTSRTILSRLEKEIETNVAISLNVSSNGEKFEIGGRGELQLGILIENMRREGFEMSVSRPKVLFKEDNGKKLEPYEELIIDTDEEFSGIIIEKLGSRRGEMIDMRSLGTGKTRLTFEIPSRCIIGYQSEFRNDTRGTGVLNRSFLGYRIFKGEISGRRNGSLISNSDGEATAYSLYNLEERGAMFISPNTKVYQGMIIGEHNRDNDLDVNVVRSKQLTNIRAAGSDENIKLTPIKSLTLEEMLSYIQDDEIVEVTPKSLRLRKIHLDPNKRKRK
ncbi:translational GTPase TypA [Lyticum sinuosum]|uniref:50S ribosomal subunit assembly factor BipA n=1 Tax=Lyticum sinuosum TaxID=1332059 RepID=A0AAE5AHM8_9RICK|nr:translational GTPase TypA [Lyticum sinuosum]MDZ5761206.1 GTP-binding protein TypA [Lyticum sinuosum]